MDRFQRETAPSDASHSTALIKQITWVGMGVNVGLSAIKLTAGLWGGSRAVVADAVHSISDLSTDLAVLLGVSYWSRPPDKEHPYGHGRIETVITAVIGVFLGIVAIGIGFDGLATVKDSHVRSTHWIASVAALVSILSKEVLYRLTVRVGMKVKSSAVIANAWHHRSDALSSVPSFVAAAVAAFLPGWSFVDHVGAVVVAVFIFQAAWKITAPALSELVERGGTTDERENIRNLALSI